MGPLRIAIVGDFDRGKPSHWATEAALFHAAARLGITVEPRSLATPALVPAGSARDAPDGHAFFVATLFQPQLSSRGERPRPLIEGYLRACLERRSPEKVR